MSSDTFIQISRIFLCHSNYCIDCICIDKWQIESFRYKTYQRYPHYIGSSFMFFYIFLHFGIVEMEKPSNMILGDKMFPHHYTHLQKSILFLLCLLLFFRISNTVHIFTWKYIFNLSVHEAVYQWLYFMHRAIFCDIYIVISLDWRVGSKLCKTGMTLYTDMLPLLGIDIRKT